MSSFTIITWDGGGNQPPAIGIGCELLRRGHEVRILGYEAQRDRFERHGLGLSVLDRSGAADWQREPAETRLPTMRRWVMACPEHLLDVPAALSAHPADLVLVDYLMVGALAAVEKLQIPAAALVHSAPAHLAEVRSTEVGVARLASANALRAGAALKPVDDLAGTWSCLPPIITTIPELDMGASGARFANRYVGPVWEPASQMAWTSPWDADDPRPLVLVSFTTTAGWDQTGRIRNTLEALRDSEMRVLVTAANAGTFGQVPANAAVLAFVPHAIVLPAAAVTITHAGHGTVTASLAHAVPLVCLPNQMADQPYLARRVHELGAGLALDGAATPDAICRAVDEVVAGGAYRQAAAHLGEAIRASSGAAGAAELLEMQIAGATV